MVYATTNAKSKTGIRNSKASSLRTSDIPRLFGRAKTSGARRSQEDDKGTMRSLCDDDIPFERESFARVRRLKIIAVAIRNARIKCRLGYEILSAS